MLHDSQQHADSHARLQRTPSLARVYFASRQVVSNNVAPVAVAACLAERTSVSCKKRAKSNSEASHIHCLTTFLSLSKITDTLSWDSASVVAAYESTC